MATLTGPWADHIYNLLNRGTAPPDLSGGVYLRVFAADPAGTFTNEVAGGSYTGQNIASTMGAPTDGVGTSTGIISFIDMPAVTATHWAKCKSAAGTSDADEMIESDTLSSPVTLTAGQTLSIPAGDLDSTAS